MFKKKGTLLRILNLGFMAGVALAVCSLLQACTSGSSGDSDSTQLAIVALAVAQNANQTTTDTSCAGTGACKMFATNANVTKTTGVSGLDSQCASDSHKPSGGGTYKAMVADGTNRIACTTANCSGGTSEHTNWVLKPSKEYRRADGTTVIGTTTANGIFSFPLTAAIQTTVVGSNTTITGLNANWTSNGNDCSDFTTTTAVNFSSGLHDNTGTNLIYIGTAGCTNNAKIICVEQ